MKKTILAAVAAGALAVGGAASAQTFGDFLGNIFGYGPTYGTSNGIPAVVAGAQPHGTVYVDRYGRQFYMDQWGRQVYVQPQTQTQTIVGYDNWGRPIYGTTYGSYAYNGRTWDRDGDGIANTRDRWPDDSRYW